MMASSGDDQRCKLRFLRLLGLEPVPRSIRTRKLSRDTWKSHELRTACRSRNYQEIKKKLILTTTTTTSTTTTFDFCLSLQNRSVSQSTHIYIASTHDIR